LEELDLEADEDADEDVDEDVEEADPAERSDATHAMWTDVRIQPVEIALAAGVGYTLRAYRLSTEIREPDLGDREDDVPGLRRAADDADEDSLPEFDEAELTKQALAAGKGGEPEVAADAQPDDLLAGGGVNGRHPAGKEIADEDTFDDKAEANDKAEAHDKAEADDKAEAEAEETAEDDVEVEEETAEAEGEEEADPEEVPVFLSEGGKLLLFRSPESLVAYVRGSADHELAQLDTWAELCERIEPDDIVPLDEDRYELDLIVENLRGGHDAWDPELIIQAGEVARDLGFALRLQSVIAALAPGSPLDDLDEGLRAVEAGGFGSFFARRRVRKIDAQTTAALGWRTVIGKISAVVDWRN
jgi:hypothetical protein